MLSIPLMLQRSLTTPYYIYCNLIPMVLSCDYNMQLDAILHPYAPTVKSDMSVLALINNTA